MLRFYFNFFKQKIMFLAISNESPELILILILIFGADLRKLEIVAKVLLKNITLSQIAILKTQPKLVESLV